ncbi:MAG: phosphatase PAP2 family protein [Desulfomonilaceae bacterium]
MSRVGRGLLVVGVLLGLGVAGTWIIERDGLDIACSKYFYSFGGREGTSGWIAGSFQPWRLLYRYGEMPGIAMCGAALVAFGASWLGLAPQKWRRPCLVIILSIIIGPGLLVNGVLKPWWGRPRPVDVVEFGGAMKYHDVWARSSCCGGKSFPCGHCAIGFSLSSAVAFTPFYPVIGYVGLAAGLLYGSVLSAARLIQGGHFLSDILWSFVIVYVVIVVLYYFVFPVSEKGEQAARLEHDRRC